MQALQLEQTATAKCEKQRAEGVRRARLRRSEMRQLKTDTESVKREGS